MENNNIIKYKLEIAEYKNKMLELYKDLVVAYEETRQLYEKIIEEYEKEPVEVEECSKIAALNHSTHNIRWSLATLDGDIIHTSREYSPLQKWVIDLDSLNIKTGTRLALQAHFDGMVVTSEEKLEYISESTGEALFEIVGIGDKNILKYIGAIYPVLE